MLLYVVVAAGLQRKGLLYRLDKDRPPFNSITTEEYFEMEDKLQEQNPDHDITIVWWTELAENPKKEEN